MTQGKNIKSPWWGPLLSAERHLLPFPSLNISIFWLKTARLSGLPSLVEVTASDLTQMATGVEIYSSTYMTCNTVEQSRFQERSPYLQWHTLIVLLSLYHSLCSHSGFRANFLYPDPCLKLCFVGTESYERCWMEGACLGPHAHWRVEGASFTPGASSSEDTYFHFPLPVCMQG